MHMQRHCGHVKTRPLRLPRPHQLRIQMRIIGIRLFRGRYRFAVRRHQPHRRIIRPLLVFVGVRINLLLRGIRRVRGRLLFRHENAYLTRLCLTVYQTPVVAGDHEKYEQPWERGSSALS